jgi:hypothetical protein
VRAYQGAAGVALYSDQQTIDSTRPIGRAMIQMASVFGEQERQIIPSRFLTGPNRVRPPQGVAEDRGRHQEASERRQRHPSRWRRRSASEAVLCSGRSGT